jgi:hypothetical protein
MNDKTRFASTVARKQYEQSLLWSKNTKGSTNNSKHLRTQQLLYKKNMLKILEQTAVFIYYFAGRIR